MHADWQLRSLWFAPCVRCSSFSHRDPGLQSSVSTLPKLLILCALSACGAPGSEQVFNKVGQKAPQPVAVQRPGPPPAALAAKRFEGFYFRLGDTSRFTPCGQKVGLDIFGNPEARYLLRERVRWMSAWQGIRMYGVLMGYVVTDTPRVQGAAADTAAPSPRTRFFITAVESLRAPEREDCGGVRP